LSPEQRVAALAKAAGTRRARAELKGRLKHGGATLADVLAAADSDDVVGRMRIGELLESLPGVGKTRAAQTVDRIGISPTRRLRGLGTRQRDALRREFPTAH